MRWSGSDSCSKTRRSRYECPPWRRLLHRTIKNSDALRMLWTRPIATIMRRDCAWKAQKKIDIR